MAHAAAYELDSEHPGGGGAAAAASDVVTVGASGTVWTIEKEAATNNRLVIKKGSVYYAVFDPIVTGAIKWSPGGDQTVRTVTFEDWTASFGLTTGPVVAGRNLGANNLLGFLGGTDAGQGVTAYGFDNGAGVYKQGWSITNAAGAPVMRICEDGALLSFFNATAVGQQTMGAATAGAAYTATEQAMIQAVYDAVRNVGIGT